MVGAEGGLAFGLPLLEPGPAHALRIPSMGSITPTNTLIRNLDFKDSSRNRFGSRYEYDLPPELNSGNTSKLKDYP
jgi:hypothetical protein